MNPVKVSVSELNTFTRCRRKYMYQYVQELRPRKNSVAITKGVIIHNCLEAYYKGEDWTTPLRDAEAKLRSSLFEEELPPYLNIIADAYKIMRGYVSHTTRNKLDDFQVHEIEYPFEVELPNGHIYEGRIDLLVEDKFGMWPLDHKTVKTIPSDGARFIDMQTILYPWAFEKLTGEKSAGAIFNYIKSTPAKTPELTQKGGMSRAQIDTDWLTYEGELRKAGLNPDDYGEMKTKLEGKVFFKRERVPRTAHLTNEAVKEAALTANMIAGYLNHETPEKLFYPRTLTKDCDWCSFKPLCHAEFMGRGADFIRAEQYVTKEDEVQEVEDDGDE